MKRIELKRVKALKSHLTDQAGLEKFPQLKGFLCDTTSEGEGGKQEREAGTIYIRPGGGQLQVTLKEPTQGLLLRVDVPSLLALMGTLEAALGDEGSMWEVDPWAKKRVPKKKK